MKSAWFCWRELVEMEFLGQMLLKSQFWVSKKLQNSWIFRKKVKIFMKWVAIKDLGVFPAGNCAEFRRESF